MGRDTRALDTTEQLRDLVREAHGVLKDLRQELRVAQALVRSLADQVATEAHAEIRRVTNHMQAESNRHAADLNQSVTRAQAAIIACLTECEIAYVAERDTVRFRLPGAPFDAATPPPYPEGG